MANYRNESSRQAISPNAQNVYYVDWGSLPLTCPMPEMSLWNSHPQVYIPLHETDKASCMYCGATYVLNEIDPGEEMPSFANVEIERQYHLRVNRLRHKQG